MAEQETFHLRANFAGLVQKVSADSVYIEPTAEVNLTLGMYILTECGDVAVLGQVNELLPGEGGKELVRAQLMSSLRLDDGSFYPGVLRYPRSRAQVYLASPDVVKLVVTSGRHKRDRVVLSIAHLPTIENAPLALSPEMLFGAHCAVLGTTGAGKSWSVARLIQECARYGCKVILFDATGEYATMTRGTRHVYLGDDPEPRSGTLQVTLPYFHLTQSDIFAIFEPSGEAQAPKLQAAIRSLKLAKLAPAIAPDGIIVKANRTKAHYDEEYARHISAVEGPEVDIDIRNLTRQLDNECVRLNRSATEPKYWGDFNPGEQSICAPLIARISEMLQSPNLAPILQPGDKPSLFKVFELFLKDTETKVLRVSLQYLSFAHHVREILVNAAGRRLLQLGRGERYRKCPLLVFLDEAHQFLNKSLGDDNRHYPLDAFDLMAKEGRKYGLNICLATQRPRDIPEGVLSQMGTLIVHRLINQRDRAVIEAACSIIDRGSVDLLPTLTPGEALLVGVDFPVPMLVRMNPPENRPESRGPDYQEYWKTES